MLRDRREIVLEQLAALEWRDDADGERGALLLELEAIRTSLEQITPPRAVLPRLRVVRGCDVPWDTMVGSARVRHCAMCDREVYDLTAMDPDEIEAFIEARRGDLPCVQMYARPDGRYQSGPCAPAKRRALKRAAVTAATLGLVGLATLLSEPEPAPLPPSGPTNARPSFDAHAFVEPTPEPSPWPEIAPTLDFSGLRGAVVMLPDIEHTRSLDALEDALWSRPNIVRASREAGDGSLTLLVEVDARGRVRARVEHVSPGLEHVADLALAAARTLRVPASARGAPTTARWVRHFRRPSGRAVLEARPGRSPRSS